MPLSPQCLAGVGGEGERTSQEGQGGPHLFQVQGCGVRVQGGGRGSRMRRPGVATITSMSCRSWGEGGEDLAGGAGRAPLAGLRAVCRKEEPAAHPGTSREQLFRKRMKRFLGGLVFKAHRLVFHSTLGWRVTKKKIKCRPYDNMYIPTCRPWRSLSERRARCTHGRNWGLGFGVQGLG